MGTRAPKGQHMAFHMKTVTKCRVWKHRGALKMLRDLGPHRGLGISCLSKTKTTLTVERLTWRDLRKRNIFLKQMIWMKKCTRRSLYTRPELILAPAGLRWRCRAPARTASGLSLGTADPAEEGHRAQPQGAGTVGLTVFLPHFPFLSHPWVPSLTLPEPSPSEHSPCLTPTPVCAFPAPASSAFVL